MSDDISKENVLKIENDLPPGQSSKTTPKRPVAKRAKRKARSKKKKVTTSCDACRGKSLVETPIHYGQIQSYGKGLIQLANEQIAAVRKLWATQQRTAEQEKLLELLQDLEERVEGAVSEFNGGIDENNLDEVTF